MSEEEKNAIEEFEDLHYGDYFCDVILNLIEKQQKEIEELKKEIELDKIQRLDYQKILVQDFVDKFKIREKIEEIKEWDKEIHQENNWLSPYLIELLQELLEENNNE